MFWRRAAALHRRTPRAPRTSGNPLARRRQVIASAPSRARAPPPSTRRTHRRLPRTVAAPHTLCATAITTKAQRPRAHPIEYVRNFRPVPTRSSRPALLARPVTASAKTTEPAGPCSGKSRTVGRMLIACAKTTRFALLKRSTKVRAGASCTTAFAQIIRHATATSGRRLQAAGHGIAHV